MLGGASLYIAGLLVLACAQRIAGRDAGRGVLIGMALACTASAIALAVGVARRLRRRPQPGARAPSPASGSLGALLSAPLGQMLTGDFGWRAGVLGFLVLALGMLPAAWIAGRVDAAAAGSRASRARRPTSRAGRRCGRLRQRCRSW